MFTVLITSCASGPKYSEIESTISTLNPEQGRIYFYRSANYFGAGIQPSVMLNDKDAGNSKPGGFFFIDTIPGDYEGSLLC